MKLKERPLAWWKGRKYTYWCSADRNDETKINYTINWFSIGGGWAVIRCTSEDEILPITMYKVRNSFIHEIEKKNGEWFVTLDYPFFYEAPENDPSVAKTKHEETTF